MDVAKRVALVTGAGTRVGKALALALGAQGARVAVHYHGSREGADDTVVRIGDSARAFRADLADPSQIQSLVANVAGHFGSLDILINSAAIMKRTPFGQTSAAEWDAVMSLNFRAPFLLAQAAAPHLTAARGAIVNIADLAAFEAWSGYVPHGASKAGVVYLTKALAHVMAPAVRVNAIAPGVVLLPEGWDPNAADELRESTPLERIGSPEDVSSAMLYLLRADFITGETLIVDGGRHVR